MNKKKNSDLYRIKNIQEILKIYKKKIAKSLGQHYLIDLNILNKIVSIVEKFSTKSRTQFVVEIGPGIGILTEQLLKNKISVYSIEIEKKSIEILKEIFASYFIEKQEEIKNKLTKNFKETFLFLENNDILKSNIFNQNIFDSPISIIGNLPYNVASRIIINIGETIIDSCNQCCFMLQKEVSKKIRSKIGDKLYGKFSILCGYFFEVINFFEVSPHCFYPKPKVVSEVIHLKPRIQKKSQNYFIFKEIVNIGFQQRRKKVLKNISSSLKINSEVLINIFNEIKISLDARAENLTWQQFLELSKKIKNLND